MINITYILNMTSEEQFFLGMILFGYVVLILGFAYCVSRYLMKNDYIFVKFSSRIWLDWFWDDLFQKLYKFLKMDKIKFLQRTTFTVNQIPNKKLSIIYVNGVYYNIDEDFGPTFGLSNGHVHMGNGWTHNKISPTPLATPTPYLSTIFVLTFSFLLKSYNM